MAEEAVDAALAFLLRLNPAAQREVLDRFEDALEPNSVQARLRRVASALFDVRRLLGRSPSIREYEALRLKRRDYHWPHSRSVMRWLSAQSWNEALVALRLEPVLDGDAMQGAVGPAYTTHEAIEALRECARDLDRIPTMTDYFAWARRPDVKAREGRRPATSHIFLRIFGGFGAARVAAGLVDGRPEPMTANPSGGLLRPASYRVSEARVLADIRFVAARVRGPLTASIYERERRRIHAETEPTGRPLAVVTSGTARKYFFTWRAALEAAGIDIDARELEGERRDRHWFTEEQCLRAISDAHDALDARLSVGRYLAWRTREAELNPGRRRELPSMNTLLRRFGTWRQVVAQMHDWRNRQ